MAKIPRFQENQRLEVGSAALQSVDAAGQRGEDQARLGGQLMDFGTRVAAFNAAKDKVDESLAVSQAINEANKTAWRAKADIRTNPNAAEDGSDIEVSYESSFQPLLDKASSIENGRRRGLIMNAISQVKNSNQNLNEVFDIKVARYNNHVGSSLEKEVRSGSVTIMNDPSQYGATRDMLLSSDALRLLSVEGRVKAEGVIRKNTSLAYIKSFEENKNFAGARELLNSTVGADFDEDDRQRLLDGVNKEEEQHYKLLLARDASGQRQLREQQKQEKIAFEAGISSRFFAAPDSDARQAVMADAVRGQARGETDAHFVDYLERRDNVVLKEDSEKTRADFDNRLREKQKLKTFKEDVLSASGRTLTYDDARVLLDEHEKAVKPKGAGRDKFYAEEKKQALTTLKSLIMPTKIGAAIIDSKKEKDALPLYEQAQGKMRAYEKKGLRPDAAMKKAVEDLGLTLPGVQFPNIKGVPADVQKDAKDLNAYGAKAMQEYRQKKASRTFKKGEEEAAVEKLAEIRQRLKGMGFTPTKSKKGSK